MQHVQVLSEHVKPGCRFLEEVRDVWVWVCWVVSGV